MTTSLRDALTQRINQVGPAHPDIEELVGLGEQRLLRRRITAVAGTVAAVVVVIALAIGGTALNRSADQHPGPVHRPPANPHQTQTTTPSTPRPIVYSDVSVEGGHPVSLLGDPIHVGDRAVDTGSGWVHMAVTDDGVVYATGGYQDDGRMWFTDGGTPVQIASHACPSARGWPGSIITGNSGSLVAWFDCSTESQAIPRNPDLVVYDTSSGREVGRVQKPGCSTESQPIPQAIDPCTAIIGDRVYTRDSVYTARGGALISSEGREAGSSFAQDIRNNPRGLVIGDSWETGTPTPAGVFVTLGRRLVPFKDDERLTSAFVTATRQPVRLHLPPGYQPDSEPGSSSGDGADYGLFEWLDDDTIALEGYSSGRHDQDILTCRLSTGRCELAVASLGRDRAYRVVQKEDLGDALFCLPPCVP
jgi:hypothetical protein